MPVEDLNFCRGPQLVHASDGFARGMLARAGAKATRSGASFRPRRRSLSLLYGTDPRSFLAGLTHVTMDCTFEEARSLLEDVPDSEIADWAAQHRAEQLQAVLFCTPEVTVLDEYDTDQIGAAPARRSLRFNRRLDLEQTCVRLNPSTRCVDVSAPPPSRLQGLALAAQLFTAATGRVPRRVAVLGAGGCSLPAFLHEALAECHVDAVELSADVRAAARACFGVAALETSGRFQLHSGCAAAWMRAMAERFERLGEASPGFDVIIVDVEAGPDVASTADGEAGAPVTPVAPVAPRELVAPPAQMLASAFLADLEATLAPDGVAAWNIIGAAGDFERAVVHRLRTDACTFYSRRVSYYSEYILIVDTR